jgi:hypothetical protein
MTTTSPLTAPAAVVAAAPATAHGLESSSNDTNQAAGAHLSASSRHANNNRIQIHLLQQALLEQQEAEAA